MRSSRPARFRFPRFIIAGLAGSLAHSALMAVKVRLGLLPEFDPYGALQREISLMAGADVHPLVAWALAYANGAIVVGFVFGRVFHLLPGRSGVERGLAFAAIAWIAMGGVFFPLLGLGLFGTSAGGLPAAGFALLMLAAYGVAMGAAYQAAGTEGQQNIS